MKKWISYGAIAALVFGPVIFWRDRAISHTVRSSEPLPIEARERASPVQPLRQGRELKSSRLRGLSETLSPAEKSLRVQSIKRDYEELRARTSAEFTEIVGESPNGLAAFLRQMALIEGEMRTDLAAVLSPHELEDFNLRESAAGHVVQELLGDTIVTDEQKRAVFRLQHEYEERHALSFDSSPLAMLKREQARQQTQVQIRNALGDEAFALWLNVEGTDFLRLRDFVAARHLPAQSAMELWRAKNDHNLRRLEVLARPQITIDESRSAYDEVLRQTSMRIAAIVGENIDAFTTADALDWLTRP